MKLTKLEIGDKNTPKQTKEQSHLGGYSYLGEKWRGLLWERVMEEWGRGIQEICLGVG